MIPLQRIRDEPEAIREGARLKGEAAPVDEILELDARTRSLRAAMESTRAEQNAAGKQISGRPSPEQLQSLATLKDRARQLELEVNALEARIAEFLLTVPNPPHPDVPVGSSEADNRVVRTWGEPAQFDFSPLPHYDIGERLGIFDFERAAKLSGARFAVLRGAGARLQRALISFMLDMATTRHGYSEVAPPYLVRRQAMIGTGNLPKFEDDAFHTDGDLFLIPTAEVPVTNLYGDEILDASVLPIRHVAATPCWRREAGAAGKDTRGYIRLHQFDKVELVKFTTPDTSLDELERLVGDAEAVLQQLGLHYRVLLMCTGDTGFAQWKKYDLEAWVPGMQSWLEVSSCSIYADFQARRAGIRYRPAAGEKPRYVHTLNGSALAVPRTFDAVLETYQRADGSVDVPSVLQPYMAGTSRLVPS
ncbi:MAG TPA: serine--tRNA ligase [Candidatus Dormibacteraeota bacterium]|nr:serine--tRNA ligase [Candidatus Dormibacteraeota bacterium]